MNTLKSKILILGGNSYIGLAIFQHFIGGVDFELFHILELGIILLMNYKSNK